GRPAGPPATRYVNRSLLDANLDWLAQLLLEQFLNVCRHRLWVAPAEAEAIPLNRGHVRVDRLEFGVDRPLLRLAELRPGLEQGAVLDPLHDHIESLPAGRDRRRLRLGGLGRDGVHAAEVEPGLAVLRLVEALDLVRLGRAEVPEGKQLHQQGEDQAAEEGEDGGNRCRLELDDRLG